MHPITFSSEVSAQSDLNADFTVMKKNENDFCQQSFPDNIYPYNPVMHRIPILLGADFGRATSLCRAAY